MLTIYNLIGTSLCVVSNWIIRVYTILVWNTISRSSNLDICCYHCLILTLIFHLKVLINFFFIIIFIIIIINSIISIIITTTTTITITIAIAITIIIITTTTSIVIVIVIVIVVLLLFIIYTINLLMVRPRSCRVIYYFDTPALGRRHQSFDRVKTSLIPLAIQNQITNQCHLNLPFVPIPFHFFFINIICIVTTVVKYHSHTFLVIDTIVTKHHSYNLGHPHHSTKYEFMPLATLIMVLSIIVMYH
jgi:hypothetical protein